MKWQAIEENIQHGLLASTCTHMGTHICIIYTHKTTLLTICNPIIQKAEAEGCCKLAQGQLKSEILS